MVSHLACLPEVAQAHDQLLLTQLICIVVQRVKALAWCCRAFSWLADSTSSQVGVVGLVINVVACVVEAFMTQHGTEPSISSFFNIALDSATVAGKVQCWTLLKAGFSKCSLAQHSVLL